MSHGVVNHVNREDAAFLDRPQNVQKLLDQSDNISQTHFWLKVTKKDLLSDFHLLSIYENIANHC